MMTTRQWDWIRNDLGLSAADRERIEQRFEALGSVRAVMAETIRGVLNRRLMGVNAVTVPGAVSFSYSGTVEGLERWLARVEAGPADPSDPEASEADGLGSILTTTTLVPDVVHDRRGRARRRHPDSFSGAPSPW